jgi:F-type H+-transporting ATPase subunit b
MENLGIDYKLLIAQVINFALVFFVVNKFIAKPFMKYLSEERKKDIEKERIVAELQTKEERMQQEDTKWRKKMKVEQEKILAETKKTAEELKKDILAEARTEAEELLSNAKKQVEDERNNFYKEVKTHIANVSVLVIEQALRKHLTADVQKQLTTHVLENLKKGNTYEH